MLDTTPREVSFAAHVAALKRLSHGKIMANISDPRYTQLSTSKQTKAETTDFAEIATSPVDFSNPNMLLLRSGGLNSSGESSPAKVYKAIV